MTEPAFRDKDVRSLAVGRCWSTVWHTQRVEIQMTHHLLYEGVSILCSTPSSQR